MAGKQNSKKRHHYVPRFYLDGFTIPPEHRYIATLKKSDGILFSATSSKIALENDFYTINDDASLEDELAKLESKWKLVHNKLIIEKNPNSLSSQERLIYAEFLAYQLTRTGQYRERLNDGFRASFANLISSKPSEANKTIIKNTTSILSTVPYNIRVEDIVDDNTLQNSADRFGMSKEELTQCFRNMLQDRMQKLNYSRQTGVLPPGHNLSLESADATLTETVKKKHILELDGLAREYARQISNMNWIIIENKTSIPFCTSDNPVCLFDFTVLSSLRTETDKEDLQWVTKILGLVDLTTENGSLNPDLVVYFPLTPDLSLMGSVRVSSNQSTKFVFDKKESVKSYNNLFIFQAKEFLFSNQVDFSHIETLKSSNYITATVKRVIERSLSRSS
jgi:hypothetical protein